MDFPWHRASCRALEPGDTQDIFFPRGRPAKNPRWKKYCDICQIRTLCLKWAIVHEEDGVWGGTTQTERQNFPQTIRQEYLAEAKTSGWYSPPILPVQLFARLRALETPSLDNVLEQPNYESDTIVLESESVFEWASADLDFLLAQESADKEISAFEWPAAKLLSEVEMDSPQSPTFVPSFLLGPSVFQLVFQYP
jgi:hypothetical protein